MSRTTRGILGSGLLVASLISASLLSMPPAEADEIDSSTTTATAPTPISPRSAGGAGVELPVDVDPPSLRSRSTEVGVIPVGGSQTIDGQTAPSTRS